MLLIGNAWTPIQPLPPGQSILDWMAVNAPTKLISCKRVNDVVSPSTLRHYTDVTNIQLKQESKQSMATEVQKGISLNPDDFIQGGLTDDVDAVINSLRFVKYDYQGKAEECLALRLDFTQADGTKGDQHYSAGDLKRLIPSEDGKRALPVGGSGNLVISSNAGQFIMSIINNGFPKTNLSDDISVFENMGVHLRRVNQIKRAGLSQPAPAEGGREKTVLVVEKILWLPGQTPKFTPAASTGAKTAAGAPTQTQTAGAPASAPAPAAPVASNVEDKAVSYVVEALATNGGSVDKAALTGIIFRSAQQKGEPDQGAIMTLAFRADWLGSAGKPWKFDAGTGKISLG